MSTFQEEFMWIPIGLKMIYAFRLMWHLSIIFFPQFWKYLDKIYAIEQNQFISIAHSWFGHLKDKNESNNN